ncbi:trehalose-phosphatase [Rhodanobacter sp. 7MK24]|uniref:trehalose-phosphatase n=1 Tax=Rhodanobacter sp. 7MK24 TaxID=2775922 RepID=UPI0017832C15|nr:trehalose-phosphatase [Rhodanobacter sp. 7MK24]MBD8882341.1 trehalose-phosphatase [Rhodanobacter sp. 7MK24]
MHALLATPEDRPEMRPAILLDIDGTLLGAVKGSREPCADKKLLALLMELRQALDGALAFVSGRSIEDIDCLFGNTDWNVAGLYGMEIRCGGRLRRLAIPIVDRPRMRAAVTELALKIPGVILQDKGIMMTLHAHDDDAAWMELLLQASLLAPALPGCDIQLRDRAIEFRPLGITKAYAVERLLRLAPFADRKPWYFGDDHSDEAAFAHVRSLSGNAILTGSRAASWATQHLAEPAEVRGYLCDLLGTLRRSAPAKLHPDKPYVCVPSDQMNFFADVMVHTSSYEERDLERLSL